MTDDPARDLVRRAVDADPAQVPDLDESLADIRRRADRLDAEIVTTGDQGAAIVERRLPDDAPIVTKTGRILTESEIYDLAREAEEGYDVEKLRARRAKDSDG